LVEAYRIIDDQGLETPHTFVARVGVVNEVHNSVCEKVGEYLADHADQFAV